MHAQVSKPQNTTSIHSRPDHLKTPHREFAFSIRSIAFDENYQPAESTRLTTNFANLARGKSRQVNLRNTLQMINNRFNDLADWDNPQGDRYSLELDIVSVDIDIAGDGQAFPLIEILETTIIDHQNDQRFAGIVGNNFSSYVRDYDFSVLLPKHNEDRHDFSIPKNFGDLHGKLYDYFLSSDIYQQNFNKLPVICLSVSTSKSYHRTNNQHPILGVEFEHSDSSLTDQYFAKMGLKVRYFMPRNSMAPLAFYFHGDLLSDYSSLELISTISTMETFQKIYRPEIYNANSAASKNYHPSLQNQDYSLTQIEYDREERSRLAREQGESTALHFIEPCEALLEQWAKNYEPARKQK